MKIKEMVDICKQHNGICKDCPLNCNTKWQSKMESWCLILVKQNYIKNYNQYKAEGNDLMAEKTMMTYTELERKLLKQ